MRFFLIAILICSVAALGQTRRQPKAARAAARHQRTHVLAARQPDCRGQSRVYESAGVGHRGTEARANGWKAGFESARERLLATGAFDTVGYSYAPDPNGKGYAATIQVTEVRQHFR